MSDSLTSEVAVVTSEGASLVSSAISQASATASSIASDVASVAATSGAVFSKLFSKLSVELDAVYVSTVEAIEFATKELQKAVVLSKNELEKITAAEEKAKQNKPFESALSEALNKKGK